MIVDESGLHIGAILAVLSMPLNSGRCVNICIIEAKIFNHIPQANSDVSLRSNLYQSVWYCYNVEVTIFAIQEKCVRNPQIIIHVVIQGYVSFGSIVCQAGISPELSEEDIHLVLLEKMHN